MVNGSFFLTYILDIQPLIAVECVSDTLLFVFRNKSIKSTAFEKKGVFFIENCIFFVYY